MTCDKPAQVNRCLVVLKRERDRQLLQMERKIGWFLFFLLGGTVDKIGIIMFVGGAGAKSSLHGMEFSFPCLGMNYNSNNQFKICVSPM